MEAESIRRPLRLPPGEMWCCECGTPAPPGRRRSNRPPESGEDEDEAGCPRCHSQALVPAVSVLLPDEYFVAQ